MSIRNQKKSMTRTEQKLLTRQKLIESTMEVIAAEGFSGVTMAKVAERAGLSRGIGNFHFQSKEQLLLGWKPDEIARVKSAGLSVPSSLLNA